MKILFRAASFAIALCALCIGSKAFAGTIATSPAPVASGPGLGLVSVPAIVTPNPSNDNQTGGGVNDNNIVIPLKRFDHSDYIDIVFSVTPSTNQTEYKVTEFVDNNTGSNWSQYTMQLGFGTGSSFQQATANDVIDFDAPDYDTPPTSSGFPTVSKNPTILVFSGGSQGTGAQTYTFRLDIPDLANHGGAFTLRQQPTAVPEPSVFVLALLGLASFLIRRRG